ncbi:MAG: ribosome-associated translation inhibitor RaiA [Ignavibacteriales bacterium]|nr:ribosome-associated translation inhibitor RaiA [Ignavibacteriales bacterium]
MNIQITSRKFKAKDSLKDFIEAEVSSLEKISDEILDVEVILSFQNNKDSVKDAEIILKVPHKILKATASTDDFNKSVSIVIEKLERQITRLKTKRIDNKRVEKIK